MAQRSPALKKTVQMCCVTIGYRDYLMPADKGMKLVEMMQSAFECEKHFDGRGQIYQVGEQPNHISFELVQARQVREPQTAPARLLEGPVR